MNGIIVSEKNFDSVASRLVKFFDGADIINWHSFDCGMKRRIPTDFIQNHNGKNKKYRCVYRYPRVLAKVENRFGRKMIAVRLNGDCAFCVKIGDVVKFCGNRIQMRLPHFTNFKWCYDVFQLWDANGGFKDVKPEHEWGFNLV